MGGDMKAVQRGYINSTIFRVVPYSHVLLLLPLHLDQILLTSRSRWCCPPWASSSRSTTRVARSKWGQRRADVSHGTTERGESHHSRACVNQALSSAYQGTRSPPTHSSTRLRGYAAAGRTPSEQCQQQLHSYCWRFASLQSLRKSMVCESTSQAISTKRKSTINACTNFACSVPKLYMTISTSTSNLGLERKELDVWSHKTFVGYIKKNFFFNLAWMNSKASSSFSTEIEFDWWTLLYRDQFKTFISKWIPS